ncbi:MAG: tripartite tricarboxylate transporter substrate-binding protein [Acetivibrionales bacterium]
MKKRQRNLLTATALFLIVCLLAGCGATPPASPAPESSTPANSAPESSAPASQPQAKSNAPGPKDTIEFISCFGPGGGHDTMLRNMEAAMRANKLIENPITYTYKPGGNMAVGMTHTYQQAGRNDCIMSTTIQLVSTPLVVDLGGFGWRDLTPLCRWGTTSLFLFIKGDNQYDTLDKLLNSGKPLSFTSPGVGSEEEIIAVMLEENSNAEISSVPFDGDGEAITAILGGHVDVYISELGGVEDYVESGELKVLACAGAERSKYAPDIPTLRELGFDYNNSGFRGVMGPPDMAPDAVEFYVDLFKKTFETKEFQEYLEINGVEPKFISDKEFRAFLEDLENVMKSAYEISGVEMIK